MKNDRLDPLLDDLLSDDSEPVERETWALQGAQEARAIQRRRRRVREVAALASLVLVAALALDRVLPIRGPQVANGRSPEPAERVAVVPGTDIKEISDDELFRLLEHQPLAVINDLNGGGMKVVVLPPRDSPSTRVRHP